MGSTIAMFQQQRSSRQSALHPTPATQHRFHILDALRGIAAIFVVFWHTPGYLTVRSAHSTFLAVDFFFCLSGFVIAFSYERRLATWMGWGKFVTARLIRLYPVYILGCVLGMFTFFYFKVHFPLSFHLQFHLLLVTLLQFAMLPNLHLLNTQMLFPFNFPSWSMFFEILANLGYAALVRKRLANSGILFGLYLVSIAILFWLTRSVATIDLGWLNPASHISGGTARVALSFIAGVLVLRIYRAAPRSAFPRLASAFTAIAVAAALAMLLLTPFAMMRAKFFQLLTVAILFPALVYLGSLCKAPHSWDRFCAFLGDMSYPVYLLHNFVFTIIARLPFTTRILKEHPSVQVAVAPSVLLIASAASFAALKYYDVPLRAFLARKYSPRPALKPEALTQ